MAVDVGSAVGYLDLDISGFLAGLKAAQDESDSASKNIATKIGGNLSGIGKSLTSAGTTLTKTVTVPIIGAGAAVTKMSSAFEESMSRVEAISGATGDDLVALNKKAQELGATTAFSASEVADGMTEMAKAGWNSQQIIDGMQGVLDAASASGENLATVSTIVADAITGFGMEAKDATKVADLLTQAANSGTIDINDLGESFKYIAPMASTMGFSIEDVTTALSAMSMAGIKGSQAGTNLRTMLTRMAKPTDNVADAMNELEISLANQDGSFKSLNTIVAEMRTKFSGMTDEQKTYYATVLSGQEGMSGLLSLLNLTQDEYDSISDSMENSNGVARETADVMLDNLSGQVTILKSALEGLAIQFGEIILPYLKQFVEWIQNLIIKFQELSPEQKEQIVKWAVIAAAIGPVLVILGKLTSGVGSLFTSMGKIPGMASKVSGAFTKISSATGLTTGPLLGIVAAIALVVAAFVSLWKNNEEFRNKIIGIWETIKETFNTFTQGIVERLNKLGFNFSSITDVIKSIWEGFCNFMAPVFEYAFKNIAAVFDYVVNSVLSVLDFFIAIFKGDWEGAWEAIKSFFSNIWETIIEIFNNLGTYLYDTFNVVLGWFGTSWEEMWGGIKSFFEDTWNGIVTFFSNAWKSISWAASRSWSSISSVWNTVSGWFNDKVIKPVKNFFSDMWNGFIQGAKNAWFGVKSVFSTVAKFFGDIFKSAWEKVKSVFSKFGEVFSGIKEGIVEAFKSVVNVLIDGINKAVALPFNGLNDILNKLQGISILGVKPFDWLTWRAPVPQIPKLAEGAVLAPNNPFLAIVGDQKRGTNVEAPLSTIQEAVARVIKSFAFDIIILQKEAIRLLSSIDTELGYVSYNGFRKPQETKQKDDNNTNNDKGGGDTFNFYSPEPIDEIEAAKQVKKMKRELAEGF